MRKFPHHNFFIKLKNKKFFYSFNYLLPQPHEPVPETAPQVASPQLFSALHPFPQDEQYELPVSEISTLSFETALTAIPPTINNPKIIEVIIQAFIFTSIKI
jgi:hypothetical protein